MWSRDDSALGGQGHISTVSELRGIVANSEDPAAAIIPQLTAMNKKLDELKAIAAVQPDSPMDSVTPQLTAVCKRLDELRAIVAEEPADSADHTGE